jgi:hypothetical protein
MPELAAIGIVDEQGKVLLTTGSARLTVADIHDQPYFTELRDHPEKGLYISKPADGLVGSKKVLVFARRYEHPNGSLAGIVTAALPLDFFVQLLAHFNAGRQDAISLRTLDNTTVVRAGRAGCDRQHRLLRRIAPGDPVRPGGSHLPHR